MLLISYLPQTHTDLHRLFSVLRLVPWALCPAPFAFFLSPVRARPCGFVANYLLPFAPFALCPVPYALCLAPFSYPFRLFAIAFLYISISSS